jgi:hypothetical protein
LTRRSNLAGLVLCAGALVAAGGCGVQRVGGTLPSTSMPAVRPITVPPSTVTAPAPNRSRPTARPTTASSSPAPVPFATDVAVDCAGRPGVDRIVALLHTRGLVDAGTAITVRLGPVCAGSWQYTVLSITGREPLQVVTEGPPAGLVLISAGTDVCSGAVAAQAPRGIVTAARCHAG